MTAGGKNETLNYLKELGVTMYRVAKEIDVSYNAVYLWDRGAWMPNEENQVKLDELVERTEKMVEGTNAKPKKS